MPYPRKIEDDDLFVVYVIDKHPDNEIEYLQSNPKDSCQFLNSYVGVTHRPYKRFKEHDCLRKSRKPNKVCFFVKENELTYNENVRVIFEGTQKECKLLEHYLRPNMRMGQNVAIGGGDKKHRAAA